MKIRKSVMFVIICMILCMVTGWLLCENRWIKQEEQAEKVYTLLDIEMENIEITESGLVVNKDPQMLFILDNFYVEEIRFDGIELEEEVQIFYTEREKDDFSEEKSIYVMPRLLGNDSVIELGKNVSKLRVDFLGDINSVYKMESITITMLKYLNWNVETGLVFMLAGFMLGICLNFLWGERKNFKAYASALKKYRFLLEDMVVRDIKLKYRRSVIGLLWSILNPLLMMVVITAVFQNLFRFEIEHFSVYYLTAWVVFNFVTEATTGAMNSILGASTLIRKVYIPKYIFPMQKCIFSFVNMLFSLIALFVVMLVLKVEFTWYILLIPIPLVLALIFSIGLGMILATIAVFFRDMIHLYGVFTMVWMYLTPIIYPEEILVGAMQTIMKLNPMYYYVDYFRKLTLYGIMPETSELIIMLGCSVISLLLGVIVFKKKQDRFILFI